MHFFYGAPPFYYRYICPFFFLFVPFASVLVEDNVVLVKDNEETWFFVTMPVLMWWRNLSIFGCVENAKIWITLRMWWIHFSSNMNETSYSYLHFVPDETLYWCWRCTAIPSLDSLLASSRKFLHKMFCLLWFFLMSWLPCRSKIIKCFLTTLL